MRPFLHARTSRAGLQAANYNSGESVEGIEAVRRLDGLGVVSCQEDQIPQGLPRRAPQWPARPPGLPLAQHTAGLVSFLPQPSPAKNGLQLAGRPPYELTPPLPPFPPLRFALMVRCRIDSDTTAWRS